MGNKVKHIDIKYHHIRQVMFEQRLELNNIDSNLNPTNALTKLIPLKSFWDILQLVANFLDKIIGFSRLIETYIYVHLIWFVNYSLKL